MLKLWDYWRSTAGYRVRAALAHKGIDYERIAVDLKPGVSEQRSENHRARTPDAKVPVLQLPDGSYLSQSGAILSWLEAHYPAPALFPTDPLAAARVRRVMDIIACDIHPIGNIGVLEDLMSRFGVDMTTALTFKTDWVLHGFQGLEPVVADLRGQGPFVMGDVFTAADIYVTAQVYNARRSDVDMTRFPALQAVEKACLELDIFDQSKPEAQTDAH